MNSNEWRQTWQSTGVSRVRLPFGKEIIPSVPVDRIVFSDIHHVGHLTDNYDATLAYYRDALDGTVAEQTVVDDAVRVSFVEWPGVRIELVGRERRGTYLDELLDELEATCPYHLAVVVDDIDIAMERMEREGFPMYDETPVDGLGPYVRAFVEPAVVPGLPIELVELTD